MKFFFAFTVLFVGACTTTEQSYNFEQALANEIAIKQEPKFKKPSHISMPDGSATPYSIQENWHDAVKTTLDILVAENPNYTFCLDVREARIGVLKAKLPKCKTLHKQETSGAKLVLIGKIDFHEKNGDSLYIQVLPVSVIRSHMGDDISYGCIRWIFRYKLLDTNIWQSNSNSKHPIEDSGCVEQPILYVIPTNSP